MLILRSEIHEFVMWMETTFAVTAQRFNPPNQDEHARMYLHGSGLMLIRDLSIGNKGENVEVFLTDKKYLEEIMKQYQMYIMTNSEIDRILGEEDAEKSNNG